MLKALKQPNLYDNHISINRGNHLAVIELLFLVDRVEIICVIEKMKCVLFQVCSGLLFKLSLTQNRYSLCLKGEG